MTDVTKIEEVLRELKYCSDCEAVFAFAGPREQCKCGGNLCWLIESDKLDAEQPAQRRGVAGCRAAEPKAFTAEQVAAVFDPANNDKTCKELRESIAEPPMRRMMGPGNTNQHGEPHWKMKTCADYGCQPVPDAAPSPIWERMEQNIATVAAMPDYVKGSPKNERAAPSPRAWVCIAEEAAWKATGILSRDNLSSTSVRVLPLPTAKDLTREYWKQLTDAGEFMDFESLTDKEAERVGAAILRALGVSE